MAAATTTESAQRAQEYNRKELRHAYRQFWTRISVVATSVFIGIVAGFAGLGTSQHDLTIWAIMCSALTAILFLILALDAWGCIREIGGRHWATLTPRFSNRSSQSEASSVVTPHA